MTKRLILMRHAKSSWDSAGPSDKDRALNERGRTAAARMGRWLRDRDYVPDAAMVSSAARTRETFERLSLPCPARFLDQLYMAGPDAMLEIARLAQGNILLMVGHNPGTSWFAETLLASAPSHPRFADFPTCATLVADFPINSWSELRFDTGQAVEFVIPRELPE